MEQVFKVLGLSTPFIYAAGTYQFFHWLDNNVSDEAKKSLVSAVKTLGHGKEQVASALVETFDRVYSRPLLHWRAFLRSMIFSVAVFFIYLFEIGSLHFKNFAAFPNPALVVGMLLIALVADVISDYVSLFLIRPWLLLCGRRPVLALTSGSLIGVSVVIAGFFIRIYLMLVVFMLANGVPIAPALRIDRFPGMLLTALRQLPGSEVVLMWLTIPAAIVFAWLPLFAAGIAVLRIADWLAIAVGKAQWLLKGGKDHPLDAIACVASVVVFALAGMWQYVLRAA